MKKKWSILAATLSFLLVSGCGESPPITSKEPNRQVSTSQTTQSHVVNNGTEAKPGTLDSRKASLGGIKIGYTVSQVQELLGTPTEAYLGHGPAFLTWYYKPLNLYVIFYTTNSSNPPGGVVEVLVSSPSELATENGLKAGDSLQQIRAKYPDAYYTGDGGNAWVVGSHRTSVGTYYPNFQFVLQYGKVIDITLSNEEMKPASNHS